MATKKKAAKKSSKPLDKNLRGGSFKLPTEKEINLKINTLIAGFVKGKVISYQQSWNGLLPIFAKCIERADKIKFKQVPASIWSIKRLVQINKLQTSLYMAAAKNDTSILHVGIYNFLLWYNDKNK